MASADDHLCWHSPIAGKFNFPSQRSPWPAPEEMPRNVSIAEGTNARHLLSLPEGDMGTGQSWHVKLRMRICRPLQRSFCLLAILVAGRHVWSGPDALMLKRSSDCAVQAVLVPLLLVPGGQPLLWTCPLHPALLFL
jgi:hypothetical protein